MNKIVQKLRDWLGPEGVHFFTDIHARFGKINTIGALQIGGGSDRVLTKEETTAIRRADLEARFIPHATHLREGMTVRNFLRTLPECENWSPQDYDNHWADLVAGACGVSTDTEQGT